MEEHFIKALQMIKILEIKTQTEYKDVMTYFLILSLDSLKYIAQKNNFSEIVKIANEM